MQVGSFLLKAYMLTCFNLVVLSSIPTSDMNLTNSKCQPVQFEMRRYWHYMSVGLSSHNFKWKSSLPWIEVAPDIHIVVNVIQMSRNKC